MTVTTVGGRRTAASEAHRLLPRPLLRNPSNAELARIGLSERKGAPDTFDAAGYVALLWRVAGSYYTTDGISARRVPSARATSAGGRRWPTSTSWLADRPRRALSTVTSS